MYTTQGQLIHSISFLANAAYDIQAESFPKLQDDTTAIVTQTLKDAGIQGDIGNWDLVWGPIVFSNNPTSKTVVADNTMMLVYNADQNLFVVGIAGTNVVSTYGFLTEDFKVNKLIDWNVVVPGADNKSGSIAEGTYIGLQQLQAMHGPQLLIDGQPDGHLVEALNNYMGVIKEKYKVTSTSIAVTGHSLGGALAPVMALYLQDYTAWNTSGVAATISAWPTAGPTPGNKDFANYAGGRMTGNYNSYYNPLDVIPQAWQGSTLEKIPGLYTGHIDAPESSAPYCTPVGTLAVGALLNKINTSALPPYVIKYEQITPWQELPNASFNDEIEWKIKKDIEGAGWLIAFSSLKEYLPYLRFLLLFLRQMLYQHTTAYNSLLDIADFMTKYSAIKKSVTGQTAEELDDDAFYLAIKKYYGIPDLRTIKAKEAATIA